MRDYDQEKAHGVANARGIGWGLFFSALTWVAIIGGVVVGNTIF
jgi:hypothetical protein